MNHLSTALVTTLLLPRLVQIAKEGSQPRIVVVASSTHYWADPFETAADGGGILKSWNDRAGPKSGLWASLSHSRHRQLTLHVVLILSRLETNNWYPRSKLLNIFFARELGDRIPDDIPIAVTSVCPGYCSSGLLRDVSFPINYLDRVTEKLFAYTPEEGSRQLVWAAIEGIGKEKEMQGAFVTRSDIAEPSDYVLGEDGRRIQKKLWVCDNRSHRSFLTHY